MQTTRPLIRGAHGQLIGFPSHAVLLSAFHFLFHFLVAPHPPPEHALLNEFSIIRKSPKLAQAGSKHCVLFNRSRTFDVMARKNTNYGVDYINRNYNKPGEPWAGRVRLEGSHLFNIVLNNQLSVPLERKGKNTFGFSGLSDYLGGGGDRARTVMLRTDDGEVMSWIIVFWLKVSR